MSVAIILCNKIEFTVCAKWRLFPDAVTKLVVYFHMYIAYMYMQVDLQSRILIALEVINVNKDDKMHPVLSDIIWNSVASTMVR